MNRIAVLATDRRRLWRALINTIIVLLSGLLIVVLWLVLSPRALRQAVAWLALPGMVDIPLFGPTPLPPYISAPRGLMPAGPLALSGVYQEGSFACGFLLEMADGQRVGISTAHASPNLPGPAAAEFRAADGRLVAALTGQIQRGQTFLQDHFSMDYALWGIGQLVENMPVLQPDERDLAQVGERVRLYDPFHGDVDGSVHYAGVVMAAGPEAIWVQMDESFRPYGFSGCPLVSQHTGRVIGMAVAGEDLPPVLIGVHPIASLVEKAENALKLSPP